MSSGCTAVGAHLMRTSIDGWAHLADGLSSGTIELVLLDMNLVTDELPAAVVCSQAAPSTTHPVALCIASLEVAGGCHVVKSSGGRQYLVVAEARDPVWRSALVYSSSSRDRIGSLHFRPSGRAPIVVCSDVPLL